jgi:tagatose 1,6-diphosphate aldolase GatY/KbaY
MRVSFADLLADASRRGGAVGSFTCYNLETASGVLRAAEAHGVGVVLLLSPGSFKGRGGPLLAAALVALADRAPVPACVQLDHVADLAASEAALELGAGAVMADGSALPDEENARLVRAAVELADRFGAHVEAELGRVEGSEDVATAAAAGALTDPDEAVSFVERTGAACLAVSIGNVHGRYARPPRLDWERLRAIRELVGIPLSLHGTSGLGDDDVRRAVELGVAKLNVNTELREAYLEATAAALHCVAPGADVLALNEAQEDAVAGAVASKLALFVP